MLDMRLIFDSCSLEVFMLHGTGCATVLHFFITPPDQLKITNSNGNLPSIKVKRLMPNEIFKSQS
jgi:hypothetical protein